MAYSSLPPFFYKTNFNVYRGTDLHREDNEEGEFELITVELHYFSRRNNGGFLSPNLVNVGSSRINIYLCEVVTMEDSVILPLRDRLKELGVPDDRHAIKIARLLDHISGEVINGSVQRPVIVNMTIEQIVTLAAAIPQFSSMQVAESEDDDDDFVEEVREWTQWLSRTRRALMQFQQPRSPMLAAEEADIAKATRASEAAIDELDKVELALAPASCSICMDEEDKKEFARTPCVHLFHHECIATWLRINAACPLCRFLVPTEDSLLIL